MSLVYFTYKEVKLLRCADCNYGKRHGNCKYSYSSYDKVTKTITYLIKGGKNVEEIDYDDEELNEHAILDIPNLIRNLKRWLSPRKLLYIKNLKVDGKWKEGVDILVVKFLINYGTVL